MLTAFALATLVTAVALIVTGPDPASRRLPAIVAAVAVASLVFGFITGPAVGWLRGFLGGSDFSVLTAASIAVGIKAVTMLAHVLTVLGGLLLVGRALSRRSRPQLTERIR